MTHRLATNYAKNYCNRTLTAKVIVENVGTFFWDTVYTVRHKKLHPSYWYNNFAKLCHTMIIFGT